MAHQIMLGNLPDGTTTEAIEALLSDNPPLQITAPMDRVCFINFGSSFAAFSAITSLNGRAIGHTIMTAAWSYQTNVVYIANFPQDMQMETLQLIIQQTFSMCQRIRVERWGDAARVVLMNREAARFFLDQVWRFNFRIHDAQLLASYYPLPSRVFINRMATRFRPIPQRVYVDQRIIMISNLPLNYDEARVVSLILHGGSFVSCQMIFAVNMNLSLVRYVDARAATWAVLYCDGLVVGGNVLDVYWV